MFRFVFALVAFAALAAAQGEVPHVPAEVQVGETVNSGSCNPAGFVSVVPTDGGDKGKCLEIQYPDGKNSRFWFAMGWKYKTWTPGPCDKSKFGPVDRKEKDYDGWTDAKNSPDNHCGGVSLTVYKPNTQNVLKTTLSAAAGACMDDADQAAWKKESSNFSADMAKCGKKCLGAKACVSTCMQQVGGYTAPCGDCMGDVAACTKTHCMLQCISGQTPSCTACVKKAGCDTAFTTCSGVTPPGALVGEVVRTAAEAMAAASATPLTTAVTCGSASDPVTAKITVANHAKSADTKIDLCKSDKKGACKQCILDLKTATSAVVTVRGAPDSTAYVLFTFKKAPYQTATIYKDIATGKFPSKFTLSDPKASIHEDRWESSVTQLQVSNGVCPGSKAWVHAKTQLAVSFQNSCADVMKEVNLRVSSQASGAWVDPHNKGKYTIASSTANAIHLHHLTGNGKYTDELILTFSGSGNSCSVTACSESQVTSVLDFSTNYCNLHDLYCSDNECNADNLKGHTKLTYTEKIIENSSKQHATSDCYKSKSNAPSVPQVEFLSEVLPL